MDTTPRGDAGPRPRRGTSLRWRIALLAATTAMLAAAIIAWLGYLAENRAALAGVDARLRAIVVALPEVIPPGYTQRALEGWLPQAEHDDMVRRLSALAAEAGVFYLYTCVEYEGGVRFVTTSESEQERLDGTVHELLEVYQHPPEELLATLRDDRMRYASYTDEFGSFRSVFMAVEDAGTRWVAGGDVRLDVLRAIAHQNMRWSLASGGLVALLVGALGALAGHRLAAPIVRLTRHIETFTDDDFTNDDESIAALREMVRTNSSETGEMAWTFLDMRDKLVAHLEELTRVTAEKERIASQLDIARSIQRSLLPARAPVIQGYEIAGWSEAADQTGGDFYDWEAIDGGRVVVSVGDVTGHGLGPAIMATACRAYARAVLGEPQPLRELVTRLNRLVHHDARNGQFVTFFTGVLDPARAEMLVLSAGHGPGLLHRAATGEVSRIDTHGIPLGVDPEFDMAPGSVIGLEPGDVILIVSDGFFEWQNPQREQFGIERLVETFRGAAGRPAAEMIDALREAVAAFTKDSPQPDDMTAVVVKRLA